MIVTQTDIRSRIEQLTLNYNGFRRQLERLDLAPERQARLQNEVRVLGEELATLEKIAQLGRVEPDRAKIEALVRERVDALRPRMASDPALARLQPEERDLSSGEMRALLWALEEDTLSRVSRELNVGRPQADPAQIDRAVAATLKQTLESGPDAEARAGAAYELGKLHIAQAIPSLAVALNDQPLVAEVALRALAGFSDEQLRQAGLAEAAIEKIRTWRRSG